MFDHYPRILKNYFMPKNLIRIILMLLLVLLPLAAAAHGISDEDRQRMLDGGHLQFAYLGAKHMVTGYDHLLFLFGVIFYLFRMREVALYVTLFSIGHSVTLLIGVLGDIHFNPYIIDAIIGLSVVYKAVDNLNGFMTLFRWQPNPKAAVMLFGLVHGFGLATKLQDFALPRDGLVLNILAFNLGVEIGQLLALGGMLIVMGFWRQSEAFNRQAFAVNTALMAAGFVLIGLQLTGFYLS